MPGERKEIMASLIQILQELGSALTAEEALHVIVEHVKVMFPHQSLAILLRDENTGALNIKMARQLSYSFIKQFQRNIGGEIVPRVLLRHDVVFLNDINNSDPEYAQLKLEHDFRHICVTPIIQNQRAIGYLHCDRMEEAPFTAEDAQRMLVLGYLIGQQILKFELLFLTRHLTLVDEASKALKYQAFVEQFRREIARAKTYHSPLSLIFLHLDDYVAFVATSGINAGHTLLDKTHRLIKRCVRDIDIIGRFSANEFIVCMCGLKKDESESLFERIRTEIKEIVTPATGQIVNVSGVLMTLEPPADLELPLEKIFAALGSGLLTARAKGKHQSIIVEPPRK